MIYRVYKILCILILLGFILLASTSILNINNDWIIWIASAMFGGGLLINLILIFPLMRTAQENDHEFPETLILSFTVDDDEFGSQDFRKNIQSLAARIEESVCEGKFSTFDGDEFGNGEAKLYFNTLASRDLWNKMNNQFGNEDQFRPSSAICVDSNGNEIEILKNP